MMGQEKDVDGALEPDIAELIQQAGRRPPMPPIDIESLAAPAALAFERRAQRLRLRRRVAWAAMLMLTVGAVFALRLLWSDPSEMTVSEMTASELTVVAQRGTEYAVGDGVGPGRVVSTDEGRLAVRTAEGHHLRLDVGTELRHVSRSRLDLLRGAVYVDAAPADLSIHAAGTVTEHVGTRYEVRVDGESVAVRVRDGRVRVECDGRSVTAERGRQVKAGASSLEVSDASPTDPSWNWTRDVAPPVSEEGTLLSFFHWFEGETGLQVEAGPRWVRNEDGEPIRIHGRVEDSEPMEALATVLETAGLTFSRQGDRVVVEPMAGLE